MKLRIPELRIPGTSMISFVRGKDEEKGDRC
jgi:hypothetical protein